jgi:hypothetical protein
MPARLCGTEPRPVANPETSGSGSAEERGYGPVRGCRPAFAVLALWLAAGCADGSPAASVPPVPPPAPVMAVLTCAVQVRAATLACQPPRATPEGVSAALLGGQHQNVRLFAWRVSYDGSAVFSADVTVQNLITQVIGTKDNRTAAPEGVRVFFHSGPIVTAGSGAVSVANADGVGTFTASDQPYFQYSEMLATGAVSLRREWKFSVPNTVETFEFVVYVAAPVRYEDGWIKIAPRGASATVNSVAFLRATVYGVTGLTLPQQPIQWSSDNPAVATVNDSGRVTAKVQGSAVITAKSGRLSASVVMQVYPDLNLFPDNYIYNYGVPPSYGFSVVPLYARANSRDAVLLTAFPGYLNYIKVVFRSPSGTQTRTCSGWAGRIFPATQCELVFSEDAERGLWSAHSIVVMDYRTGTERTFTEADIEDAGGVIVFQVRDPNTVRPPICEWGPWVEPGCYTIPYWLPGWHSKLPAATPPALSAPPHP